ncbi:MAG: AAA family ATPase [Acidobacteria bacterium]|nr:AAA family ATPase [Acidobacteriota bacterium]
MLEHLRVRNLGVLEEATIEPSTRLTVITGETGAGKTLLLGGLRLILGEKPDPGAVGPMGDRAQADGLFRSGDEELGVTRVVPRQGNSRAHLEGSVVSARTLSNRVGALVEIVGQHDRLSLKRPSHVLSLVDSALDEAGRLTSEAYRSAWDDLKDAEDRLEMLGGDEMALRRELDLVRFQASEIEGAGLEPDEDEHMEAKALRLRNVEEIREHLAETLRAIDRMTEDGGEAVSRIRKVSTLDPGLASLTEDVDAAAADIAELGREVRRAADDLDSDPSLLNRVEDRLTAIGDLKRKYGRTLGDVIDFGEQARERAGQLDSLLSTAGELEAVLSRARGALASAGSNLTEARLDAASGLAKEAASHLGDMGLGEASLELRIESVEPGPNGADRIELWFSSDERLEPGPVNSVASGGELSRLVLAVRLATQRPDTATLVFDEVDAGVGGATALALGRKLADLAEDSQILCVTHLPQVAAYADIHYVVERQGGSARVYTVDGDARLREISRMLAGLPESTAGHQAAAELLAAVSD